MSYEEPDYEVLRETPDFELRHYASYIVAEVDVAGSFRNAGGNAFRALAGYIFGRNSESARMSMTVPVESRLKSPDASTNERLSRPTGLRGADDSIYTYGFVMERRFAMDELPRPLDDRIRLVSVPARVVAARRYAGFWSAANYRKNETALLGALAEAGIAVRGTPVLARYNGPATPWFLRRNEVLVEVEWPTHQAGR